MTNGLMRDLPLVYMTSTIRKNNVSERVPVTSQAKMAWNTRLSGIHASSGTVDA